MKRQIVNKDVFVSRFKECFEQSGETTYSLAEKTSLTAATISRYLNGIIVPKVTTLYAFAEIFKVNPSWLIGYDEPKHISTHPTNVIPLPEMKKVPLLGEIACGEPIFAEEQYGEYIDLEAGVSADFCLRAKGDSMIGARIQDGDIVFIRKQDVVANGEIAAVLIDNEATLKRVYYYPEKAKIVLNPENPKYEPLVYVGEELNEIRILGKAVAFQSSVI